MSADTTRDRPHKPRDPAAGDNRKQHSGAETRVHILAAAAELAKEKGAAHISIEAIAQRAGLSKGGLLYHFPKKDALIQALVEQHLGEIDAELAGVEAKVGVQRSNAVARAFIELNRAKVCAHRRQLDGILLALAENPHLLDPVRAHAERVVERVRRTASDRELSLIALLVIEGMRSTDLFDTNQLSTEECTAVLERMLALLGDGEERADNGRTA